MKALVLSGGTGTRMRPITYTMAKQLLPVANKPVLFYALEAITSAGVNDIGIVVGDTEHEIRQAVGDGSRWGAKVTYIRQDKPLGLAHAVKISHEFINDEPFVMYLGDNLVLDGITGFVKTFEANKPNALILLAAVQEPQRFGVAELKDGKVVGLEEKPKNPKSNLALVGVYIFDKAIFTAVNAIAPSARGELEITDAIQYLIDQGLVVEPHIITGWWKDTGRPEDILEANRMILERLEAKCEGEVIGSEIQGRVAIESGARVVDSVIRGPVIIGKGSVIEHSYIGPFTSVHDYVEIRHAEIEHSIVMERARIIETGAKIDASLIGKEVLISRSKKLPTAYRLIVGDNSKIELL
jgi:glucose-1-phosphate thymidylyltransferase